MCTACTGLQYLIPVLCLKLECVRLEVLQVVPRHSGHQINQGHPAPSLGPHLRGLICIALHEFGEPLYVSHHEAHAARARLAQRPFALLPNQLRQARHLAAVHVDHLRRQTRRVGTAGRHRAWCGCNYIKLLAGSLPPS
jgi:hypothetical protein